MDSTFTTHPPADRPSPSPAGLYSTPWRAITIGLLALISIQAFEQLAVATVMPLVAQALGGPQWYAAAFGVAVAASIVGMALAGRWCDGQAADAGSASDAGRGTDARRAGGADATLRPARRNAGHHRALVVGVLAFALGVLLAGCAPSMPWLVLGRALQGLGTGLTAVTLYVVAGQAYPAALRPRLFAAFAAAWVAPVVVGPALASLIERSLGWRWVFLLAVLLTVPAALLLRQGLAARRLGHPAATADDPPGRPGAAAAAAAAAPAGNPEGTSTGTGTNTRTTLLWAIVTALGAAALHAGNAASTWALVLGGAAVLLGAPRLLPAGVWTARRGLPTVIVLRGLIAAAFFCGEVLIPLLLIGQRGLSAFEAGLVLTIGALGWSAGSWWQGRLADRAPHDASAPGHGAGGQASQRQVRLLRGGLGLLAFGLLTTLSALHPAAPLALVAAGWTVAGLGIGMAFPTLSVLMLELAPPAGQGQASAALQLSDSICSALALAAAGAALVLLQPGWPRAAFVTAFGLAAALALLGALLAPRVSRAASA